jgi:hypothetical protein
MKSAFTMTFFLLAAFSFADSAIGQPRWYRGNPRGAIQSLENNTDRFRRSLDRALDRSRLNGTRAEDQINEYVDSFEQATDRLREQAEERQTAPAAAREVLTRGRRIDAFMRRYQFARNAENDWVRVRNDLNRLATSYYIRWRW